MSFLDQPVPKIQGNAPQGSHIYRQWAPVSVVWECYNHVVAHPPGACHPLFFPHVGPLNLLSTALGPQLHSPTLWFLRIWSCTTKKSFSPSHLAPQTRFGFSLFFIAGATSTHPPNFFQIFLPSVSYATDWLGQPPVTPPGFPWPNSIPLHPPPSLASFIFAPGSFFFKCYQQIPELFFCLFVFKVDSPLPTVRP